MRLTCAAVQSFFHIGFIEDTGEGHFLIWKRRQVESQG